VETIDKAKTYLNRNNYLVAAERNGKIVTGFNLGNSPLEYLDNDKLNNRSLVITTTNGTKSIEHVKGADSVILASFLNVNAVVQYILKQNKDVIIICSGWKDRVCLEDMLLAGMISCKLTVNKSILTTQDSVTIVIELYKKSRKDMSSFLSQSAYCKRMDLKEDIDYCLQLNTMNIVPILCNESFIV
jgi:2-phosphosulfolactate phosphatase